MCVFAGGGPIRAKVQGPRRHEQLWRLRGGTTAHLIFGEMFEGVCRLLERLLCVNAALCGRTEGCLVLTRSVVQKFRCLQLFSDDFRRLSSRTCCRYCLYTQYGQDSHGQFRAYTNVWTVSKRHVCWLIVCQPQSSVMRCLAADWLLFTDSDL